MSSEIFNEINAQERKLTEKKAEQNLSQQPYNHETGNVKTA